MRFNINLATQPYEDAARFYRRWLPLLALAGLLAVVLIALSLSAWLSASSVRKNTAALQAELDKLNQERAAAEALLNRPENRGLRERSQFLNTLIARKAFSWTQVFADLEKVVPPRVQVKSIQPGITPDNQLQIRMQLNSASREKEVELVRRMEGSPAFRHPEVQAEASREGEGIEFEVVAVYVPQARGGGD